MVLITASIGWLAMSLQIACPAMPFTQAEAKQAALLAHEILPEHLQAQAIDDTKVSKCAISTQVNERMEQRIETVRYRALFRNRSQVPDTTVRDVVNCRMSVTTRNDTVIAIERGCSLGVETRLTFDGILQDVEIPDGVHVDDVRQFLTYLSRQVGSVIDGRVFTEKEYSHISKIMGNIFGDRKFLSAVYESGCTSSWIKVLATGESVLEFGKLGRRGAIC